MQASDGHISDTSSKNGRHRHHHPDRKVHHQSNQNNNTNNSNQPMPPQNSCLLIDSRCLDNSPGGATHKPPLEVTTSKASTTCTAATYREPLEATLVWKPLASTQPQQGTVDGTMKKMGSSGAKGKCRLKLPTKLIFSFFDPN